MPGPAYSNAFTTNGLKHVPQVRLPDVITREWAWGGATGKGIKVAVIDSGIDASHPAIGGDVQGYVAISPEPGSKTETFIYDTEPHDDVFGHGTACGAIIRSMAPECELYSVRVLGAKLGGKGNVFLAGLRWAIENGMHVCNLSLSTHNPNYYGPLHDLVDKAYHRGVFLVAAANNIQLPSFPALYAAVFSVGSHDTPEPSRFYYNPQPPVEFGAWGINVPLAWKDNSTLTATGNSFAAPHIAGLLTLLRSKHPDLTPAQAKAVMQALADNVDAPQATDA